MAYIFSSKGYLVQNDILLHLHILNEIQYFATLHTKEMFDLSPSIACKRYWMFISLFVDLYLSFSNLPNHCVYSNKQLTNKKIFSIIYLMNNFPYIINRRIIKLSRILDRQKSHLMIYKSSFLLSFSISFPLRLFHDRLKK